ncbi:MAG: ketoacyl-ACP synthase III [Anaerolineales bacterium]|nr:ketoacyl-ACP synthase III [Anaerolineales bacterium]
MAERYGNIVGWGKYVPERVVTNADFEKILDTTDEWIVSRTGIHERRHAAEGENTSQMSTAAARDALEMAGVRPKELDLIIVATSTPDYLTPPVSSQVQHMLGAGTVGAFTLVTGCTGFVYGLATAQQFIASGAADNVLVIGAELVSRFVDWEDRATCVLFGDGAGAVVVQATDEPSGVLSFVLGSDGSGAEHLILPAGGAANPITHEALVNGEQYLKMNGREVFKFATKVLGKSLRQAIAEAGMTSDDIDLIIPHQANVRIIESAARQAKLSKEKVFVNIQKYGNTSAASIPIALCEALEEGRAKIGDTFAFVSFGAGLTWASAIVKLVEHKQPVPKRNWQLPFLKWFSRNDALAVEADAEAETEAEQNFPVE